MTKLHRWKHSTIVAAFLCAVGLIASPAQAQERPHGLEPADDIPFIPDLGGLRVKTFRNQYGQVRHLSEAVVVRHSSIAEGKATVPAGGLYYISETLEDAAPFFRDPFLVLGEHAYLVDINVESNTVSNVTLNKGDKKLIDEQGYRLWFDYSTDHYDLPYIQLALISPAGHWPLEFPVSSKFATIHDDLPNLRVPEGHIGQIDEYFQDPNYEYGASRFVVRGHDFDQATFESLTYPVITEATFSLSRPWIRDLRQEDYRFYGTKRIYAFRRPEGFLVRVTNFSGSEVLGEKIISPVTPQGYKDRDDMKDHYSLTLPEHDMRVEISLHPDYMKNSDFAAWANDVPFGWTDGFLNLVVYSDLVTVKTGEAWPLDARYKVGLEANLLTGKLQRLVLENAEPFTLASGDSYKGPEKYSEVWNRPFFSLVASKLEGETSLDYYLRDSFYMRTDNMVFDKAKGRKDIDCFVGRTPTFIPILEDTFLTRLAMPAYGVEVPHSHFTSFPKAINNMAFHSPDPTAPFVGRTRSFKRDQRLENRRGERLTSAEGLVIRGSYVDWRNDRIVIPPAGLFYTSRNARNVRALRGESFFVLGKKAYIATFESTTFVRKNFDLDFWKVQPEGSLNPIFWQDEPLGVNNKVLRMTQHALLDDRPMGMVNVVKYSGNNFGAPFLMAQNLNREDPQTRYYLNDKYAEGATWIIPEFIGENYMRISEFGTPAIQNVQFTYTEPQRVVLGEGESQSLGDYTVSVQGVDEFNGEITVSINGPGGSQTKVLGPLNAETQKFLPQHQKIVNTLQLVIGPDDNKVMAEMDILHPFEDGKAGLWLYQNLEKLTADTPLQYDERFMVRPDVCGHCYQLNELLFDNPEEIVLDKNNPVFEGPRDSDGNVLFSIVIDSFDGEMIHAWHIESTIKGRTFSSDNLAFNPRNNIDVLVGVNGTTEGFLRASMLERSAFQEYWRNGLHQHPLRGAAEWMSHKFQ